MAIEQSKYVDANSVIAGSDQKGSSIQGPEETSEFKMVMSLLSQGKSYRETFDSDWDKRLDYYKGKQWGNHPNTGWAKPVFNIVRQIIQATLPILTDQRPGFNVIAAEPSDFRFAQIMSMLVEHWWDNSSMDHTLLEVLWDSMLYDAGILKITWDPDLEDGIGDVSVERIDPRDIYVPEGCQDFTKNCGWVIQRSQKQVGELKRLFPDMSEYIKSDASSEEDSTKYGGMDIKLVSPIDQNDKRGKSGDHSNSSNRRMCDVIECWMDDEQLIEEEEIGEGGEKVKTVRKKFPKGKLITILPNQHIVLQSVEMPYAHGRKPYVRIVDMILPGEFWGEGESKSLMQTQRMINVTLQQAFDTLQTMANTCWVVEKDSGVDVSKISNRTAAVIQVDPGKIASIRRDFPPALQSGVLDFFQTLVRQAESITGISEITQGRKPSGVTAAAAIENLQEASQTRIRLKERNMQVSLQQLGMQVMSLMMQYYREPRVIRLTNQENQWPDYFEFFIEETDSGDYVMNQQKHAFDSERQMYVPLGYETSQPSKGLMDVKVLSGTAMPWAKTTRSNIAFRLFDSGVIDAKALLETLEWPDAEEIINRVHGQQAALAEAPPAPVQ
jgi:hypothetical protein